jgi:hypothetical protein
MAVATVTECTVGNGNNTERQASAAQLRLRIGLTQHRMAYRVAQARYERLLATLVAKRFTVHQVSSIRVVSDGVSAESISSFVRR